MSELLDWTREHLGPASARLLEKPEEQALVRHRMRAGAAMEDAVLGRVHGAAKLHPELADEFVAFFLGDLLRLGHASLGAGLRRFLDTGDLVQSVLDDLWPELAELEFRSRGEFLSLLSQRLRWKASDQSRAADGRRRAEERRLGGSQAALPADSGPSPATLAGRADEEQRLALVLLRLPERDRRLLALHLRGLSGPEIARESGLGEEAARKALQRALQRARELAS